MTATPAAVADAVDRIGGVVRRARKEQGLTQAEVARRAGVSRVFVIDLEAGHPRAELGKALAVLDVLGLRPFTDDSIDTAHATVEGENRQVAGVPYAPSFVVADSLDTLQGPDRGEVVLPNRLLWNPSRPFDLADEKRHRSLIRIVLREARTQDDLISYVDRDSLVKLWPSLGLPETIAAAWEAKFPELTATGREHR